MAYERGEPVFAHLGGWVPSRAINPSDGSDPVSLGLVPFAEPVERSTGPAPVTPAGPLPPSAALPAQPVPAFELPPYLDALLNQEPSQALVVDVASGWVWLRGTRINLTATEQSEVMHTVVNALARQQRDEVTSLRAEYGLHAPPGQEALWQAYDQAAMVRGLPGEAAQEQSKEPG